MKSWQLLVAVLYGLVLFVLIIPLTLIAFSGSATDKPEHIIQEMLIAPVWIYLALMVIAQFALLRIPVHVSSERPLVRRSVWATVISAALMMGLLVYGGCLSVIALIRLDEVLLLIALIVGVGSWCLWAVYFFLATRSKPSMEVVKKLQRVMWRGSILELLVAIPTHIIVRQRGECCADLLTFVGLTCGMSVMLFAFGPSVYFLFASRWKQLHPKSEPD